MGGCVTALAAWASGPSALASRGPWGRRCRGTRGPARSRKRSWVRRSVHRSAKTTSRSRFGSFVYTVAPLWADVGSAGVYTDWRKQPIGAVLGHSWGIRVHCCAVVTQPGPQGTAPGLRRRAARAASRRGASWSDASRKGAVCGSHVAQNALFRYIVAREARDQTPRQPAGHYGEWPNWANALEQPPARLRGDCAGDPQAPAWGPAARKSAVRTEGLAEGAPWARPGHRQAASCGLRRCRELRIAGIFPWTALRCRSS